MGVSGPHWGYQVHICSNQGFQVHTGGTWGFKVHIGLEIRVLSSKSPVSCPQIVWHCE